MDPKVKVEKNRSQPNHTKDHERNIPPSSSLFQWANRAAAQTIYLAAKRTTNSQKQSLAKCLKYLWFQDEATQNWSCLAWTYIAEKYISKSCNLFTMYGSKLKLAGGIGVDDPVHFAHRKPRHVLEIDHLTKLSGVFATGSNILALVFHRPLKVYYHPMHVQVKETRLPLAKPHCISLRSIECACSFRWMLLPDPTHLGNLPWTQELLSCLEPRKSWQLMAWRSQGTLLIAGQGGLPTAGFGKNVRIWSWFTLQMILGNIIQHVGC